MENYRSKRTQTIVMIALYTAVVATVTLFTSIQFTAGGYFNLGDVAVMILAAITPFRHALFAASVGSMLADVLAGAIHYSLFTGIIKGLMVLLIFFLRHFLKGKLYFIPFVLGSLLMLVLYGLTDAFLLGGYTFVASVTTNVVQALMGAVLTTVLYPFTTKLQDFLKG